MTGTSKISIARLRREYGDRKLLETTVSKDPHKQFTGWFKETLKAKIYEPNAMVLSTVGRSGTPSSRAVLLKGYDKSGFVFFTNYQSKKGKEISRNRKVSLLFYWPELQRQIRIEGSIAKVSSKESDQYFSLRPRNAQIAAIVSSQSHRISSRKSLEALWEKMNKEFSSKPIQRPSYWGGYKVTAQKFEFWQGRKSRLHDRICYERKGRVWKIFRLAP